ncbi:MAG: hypothetical protein UDB11_04160 [Peptococcaceae bacterium]|nr:hypothetical protein [Peptococcaceae bacterium]
MTTSLKDVSSAQMIRALADMNCFEQECTIYGFVWMDHDGVRRYTTSEKLLYIYRSFEEKTLKHYAMSPIEQWTTRVVLKEETYEDTIFFLKLQLSNLLKEKYNDQYFEIISRLCIIKSDSQAEEILAQWQEEIDGYYDADAIELFEGALHYACMTKHITKERYSLLYQWIQYYKNQIGRKIQIKDNFERTFFGIAYECADHSYNYFCNANQQVVLERMRALDNEGCFHTGIYSKTYWYHTSQELKEIRTNFEQKLRTVMNDYLIKKMDFLRSLKIFGEQEFVNQCIKEVQQNCSIEAAKGLQYWVNRWNLL